MEESIREAFSLDRADLRTYSPLALAFVGDAVFDLIVRTKVTLKANRPAHALNDEKVRIVNAAAQADLFNKIADLLTEEEQAVYHRGRNARTSNTAKNQTAADYHKATGFEALCGYLYLSGRTDRLLMLIRTGLTEEE